ncbi:MAG: hypothetical protein JWL84_4736 [Rhodospirillales bacterium]|nr:hypothetical protein [Rhodospirillales bacterium]
MTPSGRARLAARLERRDAERRKARLEIAVDALTDDQMRRAIALLRRCVDDAPDPLTAEERAELEILAAPVVALLDATDAAR